MSIPIHRNNILFTPDTSRVIARFFIPRDLSRSRGIINQVMELSEKDVYSTLNTILKSFSHRHRNITYLFERDYRLMVNLLDIEAPKHLSKNRQLLLGSFFTREYSIEAAAFFNPSIVMDPDQENLEEGETRVIISFRATGEGHISSIVFRNGIIDRDKMLHLIPVNTFVDEYQEMHREAYDREIFVRKLKEIGIKDDIISHISERLKSHFTYDQLHQCVKTCREKETLSDPMNLAINEMLWLADAYYSLEFSYDTSLSERVLFPISKQEKNGIEDARFVLFVDDDGSKTYYATFTAYDGHAILPKILETKDFYRFKIRPLLGKGALNKGIALFPRKINGRYVALSRIDGFNNYVMFSDSVQEWNNTKKIDIKPYPWGLVQTGNCGSPIETDRGWLVLIHGVGPMRQYCIGALLLDLNDPSRVIARLQEPIIRANEQERNGYVPNVVYTCGALLLDDTLVIPYGISDTASTSLTVSLQDIFHAMIPV